MISKKKKSPQLNTEALQNSIMMMKNSTNGVKKESQLKIIKQLQERTSVQGLQ